MLLSWNECAIEPKHNIKSYDILLDPMLFMKANILNENSRRFNDNTIIGVKDLNRIDISKLLSVCKCVWVSGFVCVGGSIRWK